MRPKAPNKELSFETYRASKFLLLTEIREEMLMPLKYAGYANLTYMSALEGKKWNFSVPVGAIPETVAYIEAL